MRLLKLLLVFLLFVTPATAQVYELDPTDGAKRGFLWKPVSDTKRNSKGQKVYVVLFPNKSDPKLTGGLRLKWGDPRWFGTAEIIRLDGTRIEKMERHKHWHEDPSNPWRQVWKGHRTAKSLPKDTRVVATDRRGRKFLWPIANPVKRYD